MCLYVCMTVFVFVFIGGASFVSMFVCLFVLGWILRKDESFILDAHSNDRYVFLYSLLIDSLFIFIN